VGHARASGARERSVHAAKKVSHGAAPSGQVLSAALQSCSAPSAVASLLQISLSLPPNPPKSGAASSAQGSEESQRLGLGSAGVSRWAAGKTPMGVSSKARLPAPATGSLPRLRVSPTTQVSQKSQRQFGCWQCGLVSHVAKVSGSGWGGVSAANLLGHAQKFATAQRSTHRSVW